MVNRTPPAIAEAGGWPCDPNQPFGCSHGISKDWHNSAKTLFNMAAAGLWVHWMVKVACGICSSNADCSCSVTLACFSCCSAPGLFSEPNSSTLLLILWTQYSVSVDTVMSSPNPLSSMKNLFSQLLSGLVAGSPQLSALLRIASAQKSLITQEQTPFTGAAGIHWSTWSRKTWPIIPSEFLDKILRAQTISDRQQKKFSSLSVLQVLYETYLY